MTRQPATEANGGASFVPDLLLELRDGRYAPAAWLRFLARSWQRSVEDARTEPLLLGSLLRQSALLEGIAVLALRWHWQHAAVRAPRRQACRVTSWLLLQQGFIALHVGMTQVNHQAPRFSSLGAATFLTSLRGVCAILLRSSDAADLPLSALLCATGSATDALDGAVARRFGRQSRMGQMLDPAMDAYFYSAAVGAAIGRGALPRWFGCVLVTRFLLPTGAGLYRYFRRAQPLEAAHTVWGKLAGIMLTVLLPLGMLQPRAARLLCLPTSAILTVASALQCWRALRPTLQDEQAFNEPLDSTAPIPLYCPIPPPGGYG